MQATGQKVHQTRTIEKVNSVENLGSTWQFREVSPISKNYLNEREKKVAEFLQNIITLEELKKYIAENPYQPKVQTQKPGAYKVVKESHGDKTGFFF